MPSQSMPVHFFVTALLLCFGQITHASPPFEDSMAQRTQACTVCHGDQGRAGPDGYYPRLAGKPIGYLYNQLLNIRDGRRHYRPMASLLEPLNDSYLLELARYFSSLEVSYPAPLHSLAAKEVLARGHTLVTQGDPSREVPPCQQCHGEALTGALPHVPGLLGLPRDYLNAQLGGWRTGQRHAQSPDCMSHIASRLSAQDVNAVTFWLAAQPLPANTKPLAQLPALPAGANAVTCGSAAVNTTGAITPAPHAWSAQLAQGAYLARVGNCQTCHTTAGGTPYAGGRAIETPFGTIFSSNLTSDKTTGLGNWTADDFWQALHHGQSRDGHLLSPAFPYTEYTRVTRADADALFAYLQSLPAIAAPNRPHDMRWPFGTQTALLAWRTLFFTPQTFVPVAAQSVQWNRGAYLVNGLGHCGACHTPRNALGASQSERAFAGGMIPVQNWYAPSLLQSDAAGVNMQNSPDTKALLTSGLSAHATASGPMALVVQGSTQHMTDTDLQAMLFYLQTLAKAQPEQHNQAALVRPIRANDVPLSSGQGNGEKLYRTHCANCHGDNGQGVAHAYPALAGNRAVQLSDSSNLIQSVLHGGFSPVTPSNAKPFGMPPFVLQLGDSDIAQVLTFVRTAWGNQANGITPQEVNRLRDRQTH